MTQDDIIVYSGDIITQYDFIAFSDDNIILDDIIIHDNKYSPENENI